MGDRHCRCPGQGWDGSRAGEMEIFRARFGGRTCRTADELARGGVKSGRVGEGGSPEDLWWWVCCSVQMLNYSVASLKLI